MSPPSQGDIFIVDDNPHNLGLLTKILREAGYTVRMINSSRRALTAIKAQPPELLMLDINMPELSGYELCEALKADPVTHPIPVIFLSALDEVQDKVQAFRVGGVDYVTKPFHPEEVLVRVQNQLNLARLRDALEAKNRQLEERNQELTEAWRQNERMFAAMAELLPGSLLDGRYRVDARIGQGGFAVIYRGLQLALDRTVAIKVLRPDVSRGDPTLLERFRREGMSATRVQHPNAVTVLDSGVTDSGMAYLIMEYLTGRSLDHELRVVGPLSLGRCATINAAVCAALAAAHRAGIIHRDVKPSNVFLHNDAGVEIPKVVDFGIAKMFGRAFEQDRRTTHGKTLGTPVYMAPERLLGEAYDGQADVYSVGAMLYEMVCGRLPISSEEDAIGALLLALVNDPPKPLRHVVPGVPPAVEAVILEALSKQPDARPDLGALARRFTEAVAGHEDWVAPIPRRPDLAPTLSDLSD